MTNPRLGADAFAASAPDLERQIDCYVPALRNVVRRHLRYHEVVEEEVRHRRKERLSGSERREFGPVFPLASRLTLMCGGCWKSCRCRGPCATK